MSACPQVQITRGDRGLVWDIQDILTLRQRYRLVGSMVGGIAGYQSQVSVMGLPMQLAAEEVALAAAAGWITTYQLSIARTASTAPHAATCTADSAGKHLLQQQHQQCGFGQQSSVAQQQQQQQIQDDFLMDAAEEFDEYYAAYYGLQYDKQRGCEAHTQQHQQPQQIPNLQAVQQQHHLHAQPQQQQHLQTSQPWQLALKGNSKIRIPLTVADTNDVLRTVPIQPAVTSTASKRADVATQQQTAQQQQQQQQQHTQQAVATSADQQVTCCPVDWQYPRTPLQWLRLGVYADLHARGFYVTGGAKFGGDFLAYPGDPHLYHAHYVVRVLLPDEVLSPTVLQGLARGVHAARKHLVLATVQPHRGGSTTRAAATATSGLLTARSGGDVQCLDDTLPAGGHSTAAEVATAALDAAYAGIYSGICIQGPLPRPSKARCRDSVLHGGIAGSVLRYITIARDSGWGGKE